MKHLKIGFGTRHG